MTVPELPTSYTNMPPAHVTEKNPRCHVTVKKVSVTEEVDRVVPPTMQKRNSHFKGSITSSMSPLRIKVHSVVTLKRDELRKQDFLS